MNIINGTVAGRLISETFYKKAINHEHYLIGDDGLESITVGIIVAPGEIRTVQFLCKDEWQNQFSVVIYDIVKLTDRELLSALAVINSLNQKIRNFSFFIDNNSINLKGDALQNIPNSYVGNAAVELLHSSMLIMRDIYPVFLELLSRNRPDDDDNDFDDDDE